MLSPVNVHVYKYKLLTNKPCHCAAHQNLKKKEKKEKNEYAKLFQNLHASMCINTMINTKPSVSRRANASVLASSYQTNYVTETSKYVIYGSKSRRRLLIKYAKLYLSTEV